MISGLLIGAFLLVSVSSLAGGTVTGKVTYNEAQPITLAQQERGTRP